MMPSTDINDSCKAIRDVWDNIKTDFFSVVPGHYLNITCSYRSPEEQFELFKQGRILDISRHWVVQDKDKVVTNCDGTIEKSAHNYNPARAIDVCVMDNQTGKAVWDVKWYQPLIEIAERYNLVEGGTWRAIRDWPHLEVKDFKNYKETII